MVAAMTRSSTCQARGVASSPAANRAPKPRPVNHRVLATHAPTPNHHRPEGPWAFAIDRNGKVVDRLEGAFSAAEMQQMAQKALKS